MTTPTAYAFTRLWDRHRRAALDRRNRRALAQAMAAAPDAASRRELQLLLLP